MGLLFSFVDPSFKSFSQERAYKEIWSGDISYEEIRFSGDGEDFNEWLKIKWYEAYRDIDWDE